jgi:hypothetical protein
MENVAFSPIGFWIPAAVSVIYLFKTLKSMDKLDWLLFLIATVATGFLSERRGDNALHMFELYVLVVLYYILVHSRPPTTAKPASMIFTLFFVSMVLPDVYGTMRFSTGPDDIGTVGGAGWVDGILVWPFVSTVVYTLSQAVAVVAKFNIGVQQMPWDAFLRRHFSPF